jgi:hypothetical protein
MIDKNPCLEVPTIETRTGREVYLADENDRMNEVIEQMRTYLGGCVAFGDEPELETLIELVGGVDD